MNQYEIKIKDTQDAFVCKENQFVLAAMRQAQLGPHGCHGGGCGVCKMQVVSGRYEIVKRMSQAHVTTEEQQGNMVLMCCVQPRGNLMLAPV